MLILALPLLLGAIGLVAVALLGDGAGKAGKRRLYAMRARHAPADVVAAQIKTIDTQRASAIDSRIGRLLPNPQLLQKRLDGTGRSITLTAYAGTCAGLLALVFILLLVRGAPLLVAFFLAVLAGLGLPHFIVGRMTKKRTLRFITRFPDAIELLVRGLRSGLPISETIGVVANELPDPVGGEFRTVSDKMRIGRTMDAALQETANRIATPEFQFFCISLAIQRETGGNLAETLANLAEVLRKRMQMKLKIRAMSSEAKASAYIIGALPFIVFGLIYFMNPDYMGGFFKDQRLILAGCGGGLWMGIGVFIMAKMINFEI